MVNLSGGTACVNGTTTGATSDNILYGACNVASVNEVWYTYVASGAQNDFTITSLGLTNAEIIIDVDGCGNGTFETCNTVTGGVTLNQSWGIAPGQQVWIGIASNQGVQGNFQLCINSYTASTGGGNACGGETTGGRIGRHRVAAHLHREFSTECCKQMSQVLQLASTLLNSICFVELL